MFQLGHFFYTILSTCIRKQIIWQLDLWLYWHQLSTIWHCRRNGKEVEEVDVVVVVVMEGRRRKLTNDKYRRVKGEEDKGKRGRKSKSLSKWNRIQWNSMLFSIQFRLTQVGLVEEIEGHFPAGSVFGHWHQIRQSARQFPDGIGVFSSKLLLQKANQLSS